MTVKQTVTQIEKEKIEDPLTSGADAGRGDQLFLFNPVCPILQTASF